MSWSKMPWSVFDELAYTREMLDRRYDDLESGRVQPIDGEEAYRRLMEKTEAQRRSARHDRIRASSAKRTTTSTRSANTLPTITRTPPTGW